MAGHCGRTERVSGQLPGDHWAACAAVVRLAVGARGSSVGGGEAGDRADHVSGRRDGRERRGAVGADGGGGGPLG